MKVLYLFIVFSFPALRSTLSNNNTCQCTCHNPYIKEKGDNLYAKSYVDIIIKFIENKYLPIFNSES